MENDQSWQECLGGQPGTEDTGRGGESLGTSPAGLWLGLRTESWIQAPRAGVEASDGVWNSASDSSAGGCTQPTSLLVPTGPLYSNWGSRAHCVSGSLPRLNLDKRMFEGHALPPPGIWGQGTVSQTACSLFPSAVTTHVSH